MKDSSLQEDLGSAIRVRRAALGFSQDTFADSIGMHRAYYSKIERGEKNVTVETLRKVARGLGVKASQLLKDIGE